MKTNPVFDGIELLNLLGKGSLHSVHRGARKLVAQDAVPLTGVFWKDNEKKEEGEHSLAHTTSNFSEHQTRQANTRHESPAY